MRLIGVKLHSFFFFTQIIIIVLFCFFPLFLVSFVSVWFVLSSSWDHSHRCHWPCLAELCEMDAEALMPLLHSWPTWGARGPAPQKGALQGVRLKVTITPNTVV